MGRIAIAAFLVSLLYATATVAQDVSATSTQTSVSDPQAVAVLSQALTAGGGTTAGTQSFSGTGAITYYWAGAEVKGSVLVRSRGIDQFRLDARLPDGTRSWAVSGGTGTVKEMDGHTTPIHRYNALNCGALTNPLARLAATANEPGVQASYVGLEQVEGRLAHHVRLQPTLKTADDPAGDGIRLGRLDVFVDATTFLVVKLQDVIHAEDKVSDTYSRELIFSDYRFVNGTFMPFAISERFGGQHTWSMQLDSISSNSVLTDSDFTL
jgi:hypothetical protein